MRVRYEMYHRGRPLTCQVECDMSEKKARKLFEELKTKAKCGWAELVQEADDVPDDELEAWYESDDDMPILDSFEHIELAKTISSLV